MWPCANPHRRRNRRHVPGSECTLDLPAIARCLRRPDPSLGGEIAFEGFAGHARHAAVLGGGPGFEPVVEFRGHAEP